MVDEADEPLAAAFAEPFLQGAESVRCKVEADGSGTIELGLLQQERVRVSAPGHERQVVDPRPDREVVRLRRGFRIEGRVQDATARPVPKAHVVVEESNSPDLVCVTAAEGRFVLDSLEGRTYTLRATAEGFPRPVEARVMAGDDQVELVLGAERSLRGIVLFADGSPAAGARAGPAVADAEGRFTLEGLTGTVVELEALWGEVPRWLSEKEPPATHRCRRTIDLSRETGEVRLVLEPSPWSYVPMRVVDARGQPAGRVRVSDARVVKFATGVWVVAVNEPPGSAVTLSLSTDLVGFEVLVAEVSAAAPDAPPMEVTLPEPRRVTILVRGPDGEALPPGARVQCLVNARPGSASDPSSADRATFELHPLAGEAPEYELPWLHVRVQGYPRHRLRFPQAASGQTVEVRMPRGGSLRGRAREGDGTPMRTGALLIHDREKVTAFGPGGEFEVHGIRPGRIPVVLQSSGGRKRGRQFSVDVRAGEITDVGDVVAEAPVWFRGVVTDSSGRAVSGARIELSGEGVVPSVADGFFRMLVWHGCQGRLVVHKPGYAMMHRFIPDPAQLLRIELPVEGRILLRFQVAPGSGSFGWGVRVKGYDEDWQPPDWGESRIGREGGEQRWRGVPPGQVTVFVETERRRTEKEVEVVAGATTEVVIDAR